jgi:hypothetical protein
MAIKTRTTAPERSRKASENRWRVVEMSTSVTKTRAMALAKGRRVPQESTRAPENR